MDEEILSKYQDAWTIEPVASRHATTMLSTQELALLEKLQVGAQLEGVRLEQEKISYSHVEAVLQELLANEARNPMRLNSNEIQ